MCFFFRFGINGDRVSCAPAIVAFEIDKELIHACRNVLKADACDVVDCAVAVGVDRVDVLGSIY